MASRNRSNRAPSTTDVPLHDVRPVKKRPGSLGVLIFLHAIIITCFMEPHTLAAQAKQSVIPAPLQVTTQGLLALDRDCKTGEGLIIHLRYTGEKILRGYVLSLDSVDRGREKTLNPEILEDARSLREPGILEGQEWTRIICTVPAKVLRDPSTLSAKIDILKFADGSIWGPAALRESHQLIGKLDGMDFIEKDTELKKFVSPILPERGPLPSEATQSQTIGPLRFDSGIWRDERGQDKLAVQVTNESDSPIRGYLFTTTFFNPENGATIRRVSTKELETQGDPSKYLAPRQSWVADPRKLSYLPDGALAGYKITLDLVVFADGSIFGPIRSQESTEVLGMIAGIDDANRLRQSSAKAAER
jgi:hypothetical protein